MTERQHTGRIGEFTITWDLKNPAPHIQQIFSRLVVLAASSQSQDYFGNTITYTAQSDDFEELHDGQMIPRYEVVFDRMPDGTQQFKRFGKLAQFEVIYNRRVGKATA